MANALPLIIAAGAVALFLGKKKKTKSRAKVFCIHARTKKQWASANSSVGAGAVVFPAWLVYYPDDVDPKAMDMTFCELAKREKRTIIIVKASDVKAWDGDNVKPGVVVFESISKYAFKEWSELIGTVSTGPKALPAPLTKQEEVENSGYAGVSRTVMRWIQTSLKTLGYDTGRLDGIYDEGTVNAVAMFQSDYGIEVDGQPGGQTQGYLETALAQAIKPGGVEQKSIGVDFDNRTVKLVNGTQISLGQFLLPNLIFCRNTGRIVNGNPEGFCAGPLGVKLASVSDSDYRGWVDQLDGSDYDEIVLYNVPGIEVYPSKWTVTNWGELEALRNVAFDNPNILFMIINHGWPTWLRNVELSKPGSGIVKHYRTMSMWDRESLRHVLISGTLHTNARPLEVSGSYAMAYPEINGEDNMDTRLLVELRTDELNNIVDSWKAAYGLF